MKLHSPQTNVPKVEVKSFNTLQSNSSHFQAMRLSSSLSNQCCLSNILPFLLDSFFYILLYINYIFSIQKLYQGIFFTQYLSNIRIQNGMDLFKLNTNASYLLKLSSTFRVFDTFFILFHIPHKHTMAPFMQLLFSFL